MSLRVTKYIRILGLGFKILKEDTAENLLLKIRSSMSGKTTFENCFLFILQKCQRVSLCTSSIPRALIERCRTYPRFSFWALATLITTGKQNFLKSSVSCLAVFCKFIILCISFLGTYPITKQFTFRYCCR